MLNYVLVGYQSTTFMKFYSGHFALKIIHSSIALDYFREIFTECQVIDVFWSRKIWILEF